MNTFWKAFSARFFDYPYHSEACSIEQALGMPMGHYCRSIAMSITRLWHGGYAISIILDGILIGRSYYGFNRTEALNLFMKEITQ